MQFTAKIRVVVVVSMASMSQASIAAEIIVQVFGAPTDNGSINCGLFGSEEGFPTDGDKAIQQSHTPNNGTAICKFTDLAAGTYAVSTAHDANGNGKTDTNFVGIPKEAWGVSNNIRPRLRAPNFKESQFSLKDGESLIIDIKLDK